MLLLFPFDVIYSFYFLERQSNRDLPFSGLLPSCQQWPREVQVQVRSLELNAVPEGSQVQQD